MDAQTARHTEIRDIEIKLTKHPTDNQTDRQTDRQIKRQTDGRTDTQTDTDTYKQLANLLRHDDVIAISAVIGVGFRFKRAVIVLRHVQLSDNSNSQRCIAEPQQ